MKITDKMRLDWIERDWDPRHQLKQILANYELNDVTLRQAIDASMRAEKKARRA